MKRFVHEKNPVQQLSDMREHEINSSDFIDDEEDDSCWEMLDRKDVRDSDGFWTEYTLYYNTVTGQYVTMFGDSDIYRPGDGYYDAEFDSEEEAREFFEDYEGFSDEDELF